MRALPVVWWTHVLHWQVESTGCQCDYLATYVLRTSTQSGQYGMTAVGLALIVEVCWCVACADMSLLPCVYSYRDGRVWDNNTNKDFHSPVEAAATNDSMVEMVFQVRLGVGDSWCLGGGDDVVWCSTAQASNDCVHFRCPVLEEADGSLHATVHNPFRHSHWSTAGRSAHGIMPCRMPANP